MAFDDIPIEPPVIPETPPISPTPPEMETRNILNSSAVIIGTLSFPVGTSEDIWTLKLAQYSSLPFSLVKVLLDTFVVNASASTTTSSATAAVIQGMEKTPPPGKYVINFNGSIYTAGASAIGEFGIYINGALVAETRRDISCNLQLLGGLVTISLNSISVGTFTGTELELNGSQTVDVRFRSTNGGTIGFKERVMTLLKVN